MPVSCSPITSLPSDIINISFNLFLELSDKCIYHNHINMMPGSKGLNPHELAHKWMKDLGTRPNMSLKVGWQSHDMRIIWRIVGVQSTEQSVGIILAAQ